jgi:predicted ATPase
MATGMSYRQPGTLPPRTSGFVGRRAEQARIGGLLRRSRLVTVTGPAGVGKTALAVRAAGQAAADFADGTAFIDLSPVRDPGLLASTVADGLAVAGLAVAEPDQALDQARQLDRLLAAVRDRQLLLILDTCEHLVDGCAALADTLLRYAPAITILATSRQPLDAAGEATFQLRPLPVPEPGSVLAWERPAGAGDAVELFVQRAEAALPGFRVTAENLPDVVTVCRRLDGIPLAIELAAVRLRALPLRQMAGRIDDRLRLLTGGRRSGTPRHRTLRAAIEWSYSLCTPAERLLWARLTVFADGFDIAAAEEVCAGGALAARDIAPAVISLVDKNVLTRGDAGDQEPPADGPSGVAFRMPATLREFGAERLHWADMHWVDLHGVDLHGADPQGAGREPPGLLPAPRTDGAAPRTDGAAPRTDGAASRTGGAAEAAVRSRFVVRYLALAERFEQAPAADQLGQYQRLRREHGNLRAAFEYALELPGNDAAAVLLATSLFVYWRISGQLREAEYWLDRAAERCPERSAARARVLAARGYIRVLLGDFAGGQSDAGAAVAMAAIFGDMAVAGRGYSALHRALVFTGRLNEAERAGRSAAACLTAAGDTLGLAQLDVVSAMLGLQAGEPGQCLRSAAEGLARLTDDELWCAPQLHGVAALGLFLRGQIEAAKTQAALALEMQELVSDVIGVAFSLATLAFIAAGEGRYQRAAWLLGASAPLWERAGRWYTGSPAIESLHQVAERLARSGLGDERFWRLRAAGAAAPAELAVRCALGDTDVPAGTDGTTGPDGPDDTQDTEPA